MIKISDLIKKYDKKIALDVGEIQVNDGSIFGLIGVNGSGKSTLLRTIAGVFKPEQGCVEIDGENVYENIKAKSRILLISDDPLSDSGMTIEALELFYCTFYKMDKKLFREYLNIFQVPEKGGLNKFSKGMRRRAYLAVALSVRPDYLLLDEAFDGLDPKGREIFKRELLKVTESGNMTVVIASHSLRELEDLCDSYAMLENGKEVFVGDIVGENHFHKAKLAFTHTFDPAVLDRTIVKEILGSGKIISLICEGERDEIENYLTSLQPAVIETGALTLEELFLYKSGAYSASENSQDILKHSQQGRE